MSAEPELVNGIEIADVNVPSIGLSPSLVAQPVSVLVATRTRILGEALADVLLRTGYEVHLMRPGCSPGSVVMKARHNSAGARTARASFQVGITGHGRNHRGAPRRSGSGGCVRVRYVVEELHDRNPGRWLGKLIGFSVVAGGHGSAGHAVRRAHAGSSGSLSA